jgi:hypothetical protein
LFFSSTSLKRFPQPRIWCPSEAELRGKWTAIVTFGRPEAGPRNAPNYRLLR